MRGNYRGLKLLEQVMKVVERIADRLIREQMHINKMEFEFMRSHAVPLMLFLY